MPFRSPPPANAGCFQVVAHKNLDDFNRRVFIGRSSLRGVRAPERERERAPVAPVAANGTNGTNGTVHAE